MGLYNSHMFLQCTCIVHSNSCGKQVCVTPCILPECHICDSPAKQISFKNIVCLKYFDNVQTSISGDRCLPPFYYDNSILLLPASTDSGSNITYKCAPGHRFVDGYQTKHAHCQEGVWQGKITNCLGIFFFYI